MEDNNKKQSKISVLNRQSCELYGVEELLDFDFEHINLVLDGTKMCIEGQELHISKLDLENKTIQTDGVVNALYFYDSSKESKKGPLSRLFFKQ